MNRVERQGEITAKILALFSYVTDEEALSLNGSINEDGVDKLLEVIDRAIDEVKSAVIRHVSGERGDDAISRLI